MKRNNKVAPEIKEQIINRIKNDGLTVKKVAEEHGIPESTIHTWIARKTESYPSLGELIKLKKENDQLKILLGEITLKLSELISKLDPKDQKDFIEVIQEFKIHTIGMRRMRNKIEHPYGKLKDDILTIENYKLKPDNTISTPTILYKSPVYNLPQIKIGFFMELTIKNLLTIFESLIAHLCNLHTEKFAGDKRIVIFIPEDKRQGSEKFVNFKYDILWTK